MSFQNQLELAISLSDGMIDHQVEQSRLEQLLLRKMRLQKKNYTHIGTRLLQIAQRRSDEALCNGNIKLISVNEALEWYKNVIGMRQEYPPMPGARMQIHNPNILYLPPENKEALSRLQGGL